jgi:hypothetical protein
VSVGSVNYGRMYARVLAGLNALKRGTYTDGASAQIDERDRRRDPGAVCDLIVAKDAALATIICQSTKNPHRARFVDWAALSYADGLPPELPECYGPLGPVYIQRSAGGDWVEGEEAELAEQIRQWRENPGGVFGALAHDQAGSPLGGFFKVMGRSIPFTGYALKVEIATFDVDHSGDPPVLLSPEGFEDVLYAGVMGDSPIEGDYSKAEFRDYWLRVIPMIEAGTVEVPPLEQK